MSFANNGTIPGIEDVDDSTFLNHPRQGSKGYILSDQSPSSQVEDKRLQLLQEKRRIEEQTLQSTKNSLALIYETEKVGVQTAEELLHQHEQLDNVNEKLDSINSIMRVSQKHLNSMKSMFGGLKTMFSKNSEKNLPATTGGKKLATSASDNKLAQTLASNPCRNPDQINDTRFERKLDDISAGIGGQMSNGNLSSYDRHSQQVDQQLENNLNEMGQGISRLKELALGLGSEIDTQNKLIDSIASKSEKAQDVVANQNRQMNRILKN